MQLPTIMSVIKTVISTSITCHFPVTILNYFLQWPCKACNNCKRYVFFDDFPAYTPLQLLRCVFSWWKLSGLRKHKDFHVGHMISFRFCSFVSRCGSNWSSISLLSWSRIMSLVYWSMPPKCAMFVSCIILVLPLYSKAYSKGFWVPCLTFFLVEFDTRWGLVWGI